MNRVIKYTGFYELIKQQDSNIGRAECRKYHTQYKYICVSCCFFAVWL